MKFKEKQESPGFEVMLPGFTHASLDRSGHVSPRDLIKLAEACRLLAYKPIVKGAGSVLLRRLLEENPALVVSFCFDVQPALYATQDVLYKPLIYDESIVNIKRSSFQHMFTVKTHGAEELLISGHVSIVFVDASSMKSIPLPEWFTSKCEPTSNSVSGLKRMSKLDVPSTAIKVPYEIQASDLDFLGHLNHVCHLRICHDALSRLAITGHLPGVTHDPAFWPINSISGIYLKEVNLGDEVNVEFWRDTLSVNKYSFNMSKEQNISVFQCTIEFGDSMLRSKF